uniref:Coproporphyrinogen oxidase n=1 Tax=Phaeomonas parva TaxID=124430 RepID=A0A7S1UHE1_9STRA
MSARGRPGAVAGARYKAAALSLVLHSARPHVPTLRGDVRVFSLEGENKAEWFGGGLDLTPFIVEEGDFKDFHGALKSLCEKHGEGLYADFKAQCDDYFFIPSRGEHRGVGGVFFDDLEQLPNGDDAQGFVRDLGAAFIDIWTPVVNRNRDTEATPSQRAWQELRRGRYLEFNLLHDRGVRFGLSSGPSRMEAIMVSAPPVIRWDYNGAKNGAVDPRDTGATPLSEEERQQREALVELLSGPPKEWA